MGEIERPIRQARRRLALQQFLATWVWTLTAALAVAALALGLRPLGVWAWSGPQAAAVVGGAVAASILAAWGLVAWRGPTRMDAARTLDRVFGLDERISTAVSLPPDLRDTPAGRAVLSDTLRHLSGLDLADKLRPARPRLAWVPVVPALAVGLMVLLPEALLAPRKAEAGSTPATAEQKRQTERVIRKVGQTLAEKRKQQPKAPQGATGKVLAELEKALDAMSKAPPADRKQALVEMNKMAETVQERRRQLGGLEQLTRQLEQLKEMAAGSPAEELGRELARGNFEKAAQQLKTLREKMNAGQLSEAEKEQLARQLGDLKNQLEKMAGLEQQRKQLEEARKNGLISEQQYREQKARLDQQASDLQALQKMAEKLGEAQQQMAAGEMRQAAQTLSSMQQQLEEMAAAAQEIEALDGALADLQDAKQSLADEGMNQLGRQLEGMIGQGMGNRPGQNGQGLGRGRGKGDRPEAPDDTAGYSTKVKQQFTKGKALSAGFADPSRQVRGESILEGQGTVEAAAAQATEALVDQKIPQSMRKHVQNYFDRVRTGE